MSVIASSASHHSFLATALLSLHALFILWVIVGAFLARSRPWLRRLHIVSLGWGILIELVPWPCPLTPLESWLEQKAGIEPYQGGFLLRHLDKLVYPDVPQFWLIIAASLVCLLNLGVYARLGWMTRKKRDSTPRLKPS